MTKTREIKKILKSNLPKYVQYVAIKKILGLPFKKTIKYGNK